MGDVTDPAPPQGFHCREPYSFFSELFGPGLDLAGAHGLLIFSVPGCCTIFHLKNASSRLTKGRASPVRGPGWVSGSDPPQSGAWRRPSPACRERGDRNVSPLLGRQGQLPEPA